MGAGSQATSRIARGRRVSSIFLVLVMIATWMSMPTAMAEAEELMTFQIMNVGTTPGVDYTQEAPDEPLDLEGRRVSVALQEGGWCEAVPSLPDGQVYTLISTTHGLTGTFSEVPDGTVIPTGRLGHDCGTNSKPRLRINYHETGPVQSVTATVVEGSSVPVSALRVSVSPSVRVTNEPVTLTATVFTSSGVPSGNVSFTKLDLALVPGCESQPVIQSGSLRVATCHTSFGALESQAVGSPLIRAVFTPTNEEALAGSREGEDFIVGPSSTMTTLQASDANPPTESSVTYTASVTPSYEGLLAPTGFVEFFDNEEPIPSCMDQLTTTSQAPPSASCEMNYPNTGVHLITAKYMGDGNFSSSAAKGKTITVYAAASTEPVGAAGDGAPPQSQIQSATTQTRSTTSHNIVGPRSISTVSLHMPTVTVNRTSGLVRLHCTGSQTCRGTLMLFVKHGRKPTEAVVTLGKGRFVLSPNATKAVKVKLVPGATALLNASHRHSKAYLRISASGNSEPLVQIDNVRLVLP